MVPESEIKAEAHKSGHRLVDIIIGGCALFVSLCSLGLAIHSGHAMDELVEANSRPLVVIEGGNVDPEARPGVTEPLMHYEVTNEGAGSARIEWARLEVDGHGVRDWNEGLEILRARAVASGSLPAGSRIAGGVLVNTVAPQYLRAGDRRFIVTWARTGENAAVWDAVTPLRRSAHLSVCYCSIFDKCWLTDAKVFWPTPVRSCAAVRPKDNTGDL